MLFRHVSKSVVARTWATRRPISTLLQDLTERGFINQTTKSGYSQSLDVIRTHRIFCRPEELSHALESSSQTIYSGVDPTAPDLHIGHLFPLMCLLHFELRNHKTIPLVSYASIYTPLVLVIIALDRWGNGSCRRPFGTYERTFPCRHQAG